MKIRTRKEINDFMSAIDGCRSTVYLMSPNGEQFDLKSETGMYEGLSRLLCDERGEMEIFTTSYEDEGVMMNYLMHCGTAA